MLLHGLLEQVQGTVLVSQARAQTCAVDERAHVVRIERERSFVRREGFFGPALVKQVSGKKGERTGVCGIELERSLGPADAFSAKLACLIVATKHLQRLAGKERALKVLAPHRGCLTKELGRPDNLAAGEARSRTWVYVTDPEGNVLELQSWSK